MSTIKIGCISRCIFSRQFQTCTVRLGLKGKTTNLAMLQAAEKRKQKKLQVLQKLYENLDKRIVPDKEVNYDLLQESRQRESLELDSEEINRRALLDKEWSLFRNKQNGQFSKALSRLMARQKHALKSLREIDEHGLYQQAVGLDPQSIPHTIDYLPKYPKIANHDHVDGYFSDVTKERRDSSTEIVRRVEQARKHMAEQKQKELNARKMRRIQELKEKKR